MHKKCRYPDRSRNFTHKVIHIYKALFCGGRQLYTELYTLSTGWYVEMELDEGTFIGTDVLASSTNFTEKLHFHDGCALTESGNYFL